MARRPSITQQHIEDAKTIARVHPLDKDIAKKLQIHIATFYRWMARGERELERIANIVKEDPDANIEIESSEKLFCEFCDAIESAREEIAQGAEQVVAKAALTDPKWAWKYLAIRRPDVWAYRPRVEVTGKDGGPVQVDGGLEAAQALADEVRRLAEQAGARAVEDEGESADGN